MELCWKMFLAAFLGGGAGASLRFALSLLFKNFNAHIPACTLCANILGCFIAGAALSYFTLKADINPIHKTLIITGFCGGLSTLSAMSLEVLEFVQGGSLLKALLYIIASLVICIISAFFGMVLIKKFT